MTSSSQGPHSTAGTHLFAPGPNPVGASVLAALGRPVEFHRDEPYSRMLEELTDNLRTILGADPGTDVFTTVATGTGGVECAFANLCTPGDPVVVGVHGQFSRRMADLARRRGLAVTEVGAPWGRPLDVAELAARAREVGARVIGLVHHETSTGVINDIASLGPLCHQLDVCLLLDAVSSAGALPVEMAAWGVDVVVASSQKGLRATPGLAVLALSPKAWATKHSGAHDDTFYFDWARMRAEYQRTRPESVWTPAVSLMAALHAATGMMTARGIDDLIAISAALSRAVGAGLDAAGFSVAEGAASHDAPVVVRRPPNGVPVSELVALLRDRFGVRVVDGQGPWKGEVVRVSVLGAVELFDVLGLVGAATLAARDLGGPAPVGDVLAATWTAYQGGDRPASAVPAPSRGGGVPCLG